MPFNRLHHSVMGELRPRFALRMHADPEKTLIHMSESLKTDSTVSGVRSKCYVFIKIPKHLQHYWSPEISVRIEKLDYLSYTNVHCLIGPRQSVWVMFTLIYAAITLATLFLGMFGVVNYQITHSVIWLMPFPVGLFLIGSIFLFAKIGQKKGRDEMLHLVSFVYHHLSEVAPVERVKG